MRKSDASAAPAKFEGWFDDRAKSINQVLHLAWQRDIYRYGEHEDVRITKFGIKDLL